MTPAHFRRLALALPDAVEQAHMSHPDFRVAGRIFATLGSPDAGWGMVKLSPDDQAHLLRSHPEAFEPASGAWGRSGCTLVRLRAAKPATVREALGFAWEAARRGTGHVEKRRAAPTTPRKRQPRRPT